MGVHMWPEMHKMHGPSACISYNLKMPCFRDRHPSTSRVIVSCLLLEAFVLVIGGTKKNPSM
jgi:hypothetical protein